MTCKRSSIVGHGATHVPGSALGDAKGGDPAGTRGFVGSVPFPHQQDEPADQ